MRHSLRFFFTMLLLVLAHCLQGIGHAAPIGAGTSQDDGVTFQLTASGGSHLVSNPVGPVENRAAVEFDLRAAIATGNNLFEDARFVVRGTIETNKDLTVYAYFGDGEVTAADFNLGLPIGTRSLIANPGVVSEIVFDLHDYLIELNNEYPDFLGFTLRESESQGAVVTIEYLVLGTFLDLSLVPGQAPVPATLLLMGLGLAGLACRRKK